jgi:hypothetical protein
MNYRPLQNKIIIPVQRPFLWVLSFVVLLAVIALMIWLAFAYGQRAAGYDKVEAIAYIEDLERQISQLESRNTINERQAVILERNSTIDDGASEQLKVLLTKAQAESLELRKELAFYKSIVSPGDSKRTLTIQAIQLRPATTRGDYQYQITVIQQGRNDNLTRGSIEVVLEGTEAGLVKTIKLTEISEEAAKPFRFGFKYFQKFSGTMTLPETFQPDFMRVQVKPNSDKLDPIDEQYSWADLIAGGE